MAATIEAREETGLGAEQESLIMSLEHADWIGVVLELAREGPGARAAPRSMVKRIDACPEVDGAVGADDVSIVDAAFELVVPAWQAAGIVDANDRLTELGAWALPRALAGAWGGDFDA